MVGSRSGQGRLVFGQANSPQPWLGVGRDKVGWCSARSATVRLRQPTVSKSLKHSGVDGRFAASRSLVEAKKDRRGLNLVRLLPNFSQPRSAGVQGKFLSV
ncbi:hypothetical protein Bbelb_336790 [Branchiostoma belcheri]|nr:hypothetical protein Bbelb_336790 [Branchiostoma belcheri]